MWTAGGADGVQTQADLERPSKSRGSIFSVTVPREEWPNGTPARPDVARLRRVDGRARERRAVGARGLLGRRA